jgi:hypothetical protein
MQINYLIYILPFISSKRLFSSNINNLHKPNCIYCKHYKADSYQKFDSLYNKCTQFGSKNIYNGQINYEYIDTCRKDEEKCGINGKYFEKEPNLVFKKIHHNIKYNKMVYVLNIYIIVLVFICINTSIK